MRGYQDLTSEELLDATVPHLGDGLNANTLEYSLRSRSRSPHPYHSTTVPHASSKLCPSPATTTLPTPVQSDIESTPSKHRNARRRGRGYSESPSASGTEADDEAYTIIKALPPPPIRPRKGLRDARGEGLPYPGTSTPLTAVEGVAEVDHRNNKSSEALKTENLRRRAEVLRRLTELTLMLCVGGLGLLRGEVWSVVWNRHRREFLSFATVLISLAILYPGRLLRDIRKRRRTSATEALGLIEIPSSFDPAPLIYPALLPSLVTISLLPFNEQAVLPNIILGLASIPPALIPMHSSCTGPSLSHWIISAIPLFMSEYTRWPSKQFPQKPYGLANPDSGLPSEIMILLFPLHQALLCPLRYLTTTSLLPAELQLLSISLINLLLFTESPQMSILRGVTWIAGLGIFVFCSHVLRWAVALARVPKWRLRRAGRLISTRESFLSTLQQVSRSRKLKGADESDADEDGLLHHRKERPTSMDETRDDWLIRDLTSEALSAGEPPGQGKVSTRNGALEKPLFPRQRSNTLPALEKPRRSFDSRRSRRRKTMKQSNVQAFLSLTPGQASARKWLYATYFYGVMVFLVFVPIRLYVAQYALDGHDPFGWAVGYLFGDHTLLRAFVSNWNLSAWIPLAEMKTGRNLTHRAHGAEHVRSEILGQANTRTLLFAYYFGTIAAGLIVVLRLSTAVEVDTRRKVFHGIMVAMLLPTVYIDPAYIALALGLVLAIFLLLDLLRASQLPPLAKPLAQFLTPYVDGRDLCGPVVVSHIFLLIGCAIPLWLSLAGSERSGDGPWRGWEVPTRDTSMVAGIVCVGMGDAAASLVGRRIGRRKWIWPGGKSLEGSVAFAMAVTAGLMFGKSWLLLGDWTDGVTGVRNAAHAAQAKSGGSNPAGSHGQGQWTGGVAEWTVTLCKAVVSASGASLMEAVLTGGNDNVIVPVVLWLLVRGTGL